MSTLPGLSYVHGYCFLWPLTLTFGLSVLEPSFRRTREQSHLLLNCFPATLHHWPGLLQTWGRVPATDMVWGMPTVMREGTRCLLLTWGGCVLACGRHGGGTCCRHGGMGLLQTWGRLSVASQGWMLSSSFPSAALPSPSLPGFPWHPRTRALSRARMPGHKAQLSLQGCGN